MSAAAIPPVLFHLTMARLAEGSIIEAGNWGRLLREYESPLDSAQKTFGNPWVLTRELVFELARVESFPDKPSRFSSTFALVCEADAAAYRTRYNLKMKQVLHCAELVDPASPIHAGIVGDWPPGGKPFLDEMRAKAVDYWSGRGEGITEVVSASPLRILKCLD
jgi:hypothetical protein